MTINLGSVYKLSSVCSMMNIATQSAALLASWKMCQIERSLYPASRIEISHKIWSEIASCILPCIHDTIMVESSSITIWSACRFVWAYTIPTQAVWSSTSQTEISKSYHPSTATKLEVGLRITKPAPPSLLRTLPSKLTLRYLGGRGSQVINTFRIALKVG